MRNLSKLKRPHSIRLFPVFLIVAVVFSAACQSKKTSETPENLVVVKSPADGIISKVLVSEGAAVGKDAGIVEIETNGETLTAPIDKTNNKSGGGNLQAIDAEVTNAENEVERTSVEVQRVESLVATNSVPPAQLDAARADFQKAQERLQNLREKKKSQETALLIERSRGETVAPENKSDNKIVVARVWEAGILKVISARVGQKVKTGQPLATVTTQ